MKKRVIVLAALASLALIAAACTSSSDSGSSSGGTNAGGAPIELTMWHGYGKVIDNQGQTNYEAKSLTDLVDQYNAMNTGVHVNLDYIGTNDNALRSSPSRCKRGEQPDITYQYGTSMPQLATAPGVMDLTDRVQDPDFNWDDFVRGRARGRHGRRAGLRHPGADRQPGDRLQQGPVRRRRAWMHPTADWTWDDFRAAAKALTDSVEAAVRVRVPRSTRSEDTVWHYDAMLWEDGGDILNADNTAGRVQLRRAGVQALTTLQQMAVTDKSVFLDQQNSARSTTLFNAGKIGDARDRSVGAVGLPGRRTTACRSCRHTRAARTRRSPAPTCGSCSTTATARRRGAGVHAVVHRRGAGQRRTR